MRNPNRGPYRVSLRWVLLAVATTVAAAVSVAFVGYSQQTQRSVLDRSRQLREREVHRVRDQVEGFLNVAKSVVLRLSDGVASHALSAHDTEAIEGELYNELLGHPLLEEVTLTRARVRGYDSDGRPEVLPGCWQLSVFRRGKAGLTSRWIRAGDVDSADYLAQEREHAGTRFEPGAWQSLGQARDPTEHPTFWVSASLSNREHLLWSDLHYSELSRSGNAARVILSLQRAVELSSSEVLVVRVGIATESLDAIGQGGTPVGLSESSSRDGYQMLLLAVAQARGEPARLVARVAPTDHIVEVNGELRVQSDQPPAAVAALLGSPLLLGLESQHADRDGSVQVGRTRYLATLRGLQLGDGGTAGWFVAVLVPETYYTHDLLELSRALAGIFALALGLAVLGGWLGIALLRRGLGAVTATTRSMQHFDFTPNPGQSVLLELDQVLAGLERAKTVVRAMGKYIPIELVRSFYEANREPTLGSEPAELTVLFSDIEGFTSLTEQLEGDALARALGAYLEVATQTIQRHSGTIDKFIGDAIMAFWNAPLPVPNPAVLACAAVLSCQEQLDELYHSARWAPLPPLTTRFGVHTGNMLVGHFGAPDRLSYTVVGDAVNLAARLEPLCKQYGVGVLVSEATVAQAASEFVFRRIDRVAVKGKRQGVVVYELLGRKGDPIPDYAARYERALDAYFLGEFATAAAQLIDVESDGPSRVLRARCLRYQEHPPPASWDGTHVAHVK